MTNIDVIYIYIYAFSRRFYPKRLTIAFRLYIFVSICVPWESNPQPFALLTQCSTIEPHRNTYTNVYVFGYMNGCSNGHKYLHAINVFFKRYSSAVISFPSHCRENWSTRRICTFGHIPRAAAVTLNCNLVVLRSRLFAKQQ